MVNTLFALWAWHVAAYWTTALLCDRATGAVLPWVGVRFVLANQLVGAAIGGLPLLCWAFPPTRTLDDQVVGLTRCILMHDVVYYLMHRLAHTPAFWQFHRTHHLCSEPCAAAAFDTSCEDHIFLNVLPVVLLGMLFQLDAQAFAVWVVLAVMNSVSEHCVNLNGPHALHHEYGNCNYGTGLLCMDRIFGTYRGERDTV